LPKLLQNDPERARAAWLRRTANTGMIFDVPEAEAIKVELRGSTPTSANSEHLNAEPSTASA